jgi:hypothetical protein
MASFLAGLKEVPIQIDDTIGFLWASRLDALLCEFLNRFDSVYSDRVYETGSGRQL